MNRKTIYLYTNDIKSINDSTIIIPKKDIIKATKLKMVKELNTSLSFLDYVLLFILGVVIIGALLIYLFGHIIGAGLGFG